MPSKPSGLTIQKAGGTHAARAWHRPRLRAIGDGRLNNIQFIIKQVHEGWIVTVDGRSEHSHFNKRNGCIKLVKTLRKGRMPKKPYFREAARRILTEDEFGSLIEHRKPHYININKGVVK